MMTPAPSFKDIPLDIVGSTAFGRYPKISLEQTFNMMISDNWLVPYAGYLTAATIAAGGQQGRGLYASTKYKHLFAVIDNGLYTIDSNFGMARIASLTTFTGDVFIAENDARQIGITDRQNIYIFDYGTHTFSTAVIDFVPNFIAFQDGNFIAAASVDAGSNTNTWRLSEFNNGLSWPNDSSHVGLLQTKADVCQAVVPVPGQSGLIIVFGKTVGEFWRNTGAQLFPYQRNLNTINFGCLNAATIATGQDLVVWLGANEAAGPVIMYSTGGAPQQISSDGINFRLANLSNPQNAYGFLFKQDGHVFYQITWPDDNVSYTYDFNLQKFFTLTDHRQNYHIAKRVAYLNDAYFFVSFNDGKLYELSSNITTYDGEEIPRIRIPKHISLPNSSRFIINSMTFPIEQGQTDHLQSVDLALSKDGGVTFSNYIRKDLNALGKRPNRLYFRNLGAANDCIPQFRFWSKGRFVIGNGITSVYQ